MNDEIITSYLLGKKAGGGGTPPVYQDKEVSITQNGTSTITKDDGYDALNSVELTVSVPQPSGKITITQNGTDIDVSSYASADVNVGGSTPTTIAGWQQKVADVADECANYMKSGIQNSRTAYTNNAVTLYTPDSTCRFYYINTYTNSGQQYYQIYWYFDMLGFKYNENNLYRWSYTASNKALSFTKNVNDGWKVYEYPKIYWFSPYNVGTFYSSPTFTSLDDLISAVQNNEITYSKSTNRTIYSQTPIYSNDAILQQGATEQEFNFYPINNIISHNETITVIPSE